MTKGLIVEKPLAVRVGDKFLHGEDVYKVIEVKPFGKVDLFCKEKCRFLDTYTKRIREWERVPA